MLIDTSVPRLRRPAAAGPAVLRLDPSQRDAVQAGAVGPGAVLVLGAPGTGKTTVALETVAAAVEGGTDPGAVLLLAATRRAAGDLRDRLSARLRQAGASPAVRTPAGLAFAVLRARAQARGEPAPTLVSGPEQDLVLAELLAGHAAGEGVPLDWPAEVPPAALGLRAFRDELRDLFMRAAERGLAPAELAALGRRLGRPVWQTAATLYQEYLDVTSLAVATPDRGARFDPAALIDEAAATLAAWEREVGGVPRPRWRLVVVDDHQESTAATARLLVTLAADGARIVALADPDQAVQTFRGATPALAVRAGVAGTAPGELGAQVCVLGTAWRHGPRLRSLSARLAEHIGTVGTVAHRRAGPGRHADEVRVAILPSAAQEAAAAAHALRTAHLADGVPWDRMAVIARTGDQTRALRRSLAAASVPVTAASSDVALRDELAVHPLLQVVRCVLPGGPELDATAAGALVCSPLGGMDPVGMRRLRRALRAEELAGGGGRASDALLVEVLGDPARAASLPAAVRRPVERLARVLAAGRAAAARPDADAQTVLWAVWDAAGLAGPWRASALAGGAAGARADRDLDAVLALFRAAETFVDRTPQAGPGVFVDWVLAQDLPADSLAARAQREGVAVLTPAGAAGGEWDVVVVAGVQEGVWPDLRLRDSLLGAQLLVEVLAGREPGGALGVGARRAVLSDELRSFHVACARARRSLLVTAVDAEDAEPSPFVDLVEAPPDDGPDPRRTTAPEPADLRGLVAGLRARLEASAAAGRPADGTAELLARLALAGADGADPAGWAGLAAPSTDQPLWSAEEPVPVSPSRIETADRCMLRWALEAAGGSSAGTSAQSLGTLVHDIARAWPRGTRAQLRAELDRRWPELRLGTGWAATAQRRRAEAMVDRLAEYLATAGEPLLVEEEFDLDLQRARLYGTVDRVEAVADGADGPSVCIVDLKTGSAVPTAAAARDNPQLVAYQLAVEEGAFAALPAGMHSAGARLVQLAQGAHGPVTRAQDPLLAAEGGVARARERVDDVARRMAASAFLATPGEQCDHCPVRTSCPARDEGAQVVE